MLAFLCLASPASDHSAYRTKHQRSSAALPPSAFPSFVSVPTLVEPGHESPNTDLDTMPCTIVLENLIGRPFSR